MEEGWWWEMAYWIVDGRRWKMYGGRLLVDGGRWGNLRSGERDRQGDGLTAGAGLASRDPLTKQAMMQTFLGTTLRHL